MSLTDVQREAVLRESMLLSRQTPVLISIQRYIIVTELNLNDYYKQLDAIVTELNSLKKFLDTKYVGHQLESDISEHANLFMNLSGRELS